MSVMSRYHDNSEGLFNGVYYILKKYDSGELPIGNTRGISNYGSSFDLRERVKETQMYGISEDHIHKCAPKCLHYIST